eukprot:5107511-Alexandrium_andersonii.AAC.1
MLPKPDGAYRPIGLLTALMRIWGKIRRRVVAEWEATHAARSFFWGCAGRSAESAVWAQSLAVEAAKARKQASASLLLDRTKAYELVGHVVLVSKALAAKFPVV